MKLRKFKASDIDQVAQLFYDTVHTVNADHYNEEQRNAWAPPITEQFKDKLKNSLLENFSYVVEENDNIIGFGDLTKDGYLDRLFTHKNYQGKGVASLIEAKLMEDAINNGITEITTKASETARPAAEKRGFKVIKVQEKEHNGVLLRNYVMSMKLQPKHEKPILVNATLADYPVIQNLGRFYVYDMSRFCGFLPDWECPENGLFECIDLKNYFEDQGKHAFFIKVNDEIAGFALINKEGSTKDVDWNMGEFFVIAKFQKSGVGRLIAEEIFKRFPGIWEIGSIPENTRARNFWKKVITHYTRGQFSEKLKTVQYPKPHPMIILRFVSR